MIAGLTSWLAVLLFIVGVVLLAVEILMPGFGVFGVAGIAAMIGSIFLMTPDFATAVKYTTIVLATLLVSVPIIIKILGKRKAFDRLMVKDQLTTEEGYTSRNEKLDSYQDQIGHALTDLRPAGTVILADGTRVDVVTQGNYIEKDTAVQVIGIDGTWLIVQAVKEETTN